MSPGRTRSAGARQGLATVEPVADRAHDRPGDAPLRFVHRARRVGQRPRLRRPRPWGRQGQRPELDLTLDIDPLCQVAELALGLEDAAARLGQREHGVDQRQHRRGTDRNERSSTASRSGWPPAAALALSLSRTRRKLARSAPWKL